MEDVPTDKHSLPAIIDYRAQITPDRIFCYLPNGSELQNGFHRFTYASLARAVDRMAWWLDETLESEDSDGHAPSIPYCGANDLRYPLLTIAAAKTGRKVGPLNLRESERLRV
jgi:acyl-CoA synthetase (AMP-forming)/AMP-acid ligase II